MKNNGDGNDGSGTMEQPTAGRRAKSGWRSMAGAVAVVALLLGSALFLFGLPGASAASVAPNHGSLSASAPVSAVAKGAVAGSAKLTSATPAPSTLSLSPHPAGAPPASGRGTFFDSTNLSLPSLQNLSCTKLYYSTIPACSNTTFNPSINVTSTGQIAVAYTSSTNFTHCPSVFNISNNTTLDVAFQSSSNGGLTWTSPVYLGNTNCSEAQNLSESWDPSLTSLSNGTLVVTYVMFSASTCPYYYCQKAYAPDIFPYQVVYDDLVVQRSFDGGVTWTAPLELNSTYNPGSIGANCGALTGWPAYRPWISANGNSVYLAWENLSDANGCSFTNPYSSQIHLVSSSNGGANWSAPVDFPTVGDGGNSIYGTSTNFSVNPYVLAASNGQVYVAYATGLGNFPNYCQPSGCYPYGTYVQNVMVANATGGTGNWTIHTAASQVPFDFYSGSGNYYGPFAGISPQLGYNGLNHQLYLIYNTEAIGTFCDQYGCYTPNYETTVAFQNSSNGGANWSAATEVGNAVNPYGGPYNREYYPTIAVDHNGTAHVTFQLYNNTICQLIGAYLYCGAYEQVYYNTTDNGTTWNGPYVVSAYFIPPTDYAYTGEYDTAAVAPSGALYLAWTNSQCASSTATFCGYMNPGFAPNTSVVVSWLYAGVGVNLTFHETNLTAGAQWSAQLLGNSRQGAAGVDLSVSGVPTASPVYWSVPWVNVSYGTTWEALASASNPVPPAKFSTSTTLTYSFAEFVQIGVFINPPINSFYVTAGYNEGTYSMTPLPGITWVPVNSTASFVVAPQAISCATFCFYYNLTWVSWTGAGTGSVSTNATSFTVTVGNSPINETANFLFNGYCEFFLGTLHCYNVYGYPLTFHEKGLPSGTNWGVTTVLNSSATGTITTTSLNSWLNVSGGQTAVQYTAWTVPSSTAGMYWVPTSTPASPVKEPTQTLVNVTYALVDPSTLQFSANFTALGLPNGTSWSAEIGSSAFAVTLGNLSVPVPGGTSLALNGSPVYTENGVGYYASSVSVFPYVVNSTWSNVSVLPDSYTFDGSAHVYVQYSPMFWLTLSSSGGGSVSPASRWVATGAAVSLTATASPGYHFLDWASVGAGGTTLVQSHNASVTIHPSAPVSEFATFRANPALTWNVTVNANGLPVGTGFTFTLGSVTYTSANLTTTIGKLLNGSYAFATETAYSVANNGTRWVPTSWYSTFGTAVSLPIASNGSIWVNYTTQYVLTVSSTPNGVVTPSVGSTWTNAGTVVALTATPSFHYKFAGWNGSGLGSVTAGWTGYGASSITVTLTGPVWETAAFVYRVFPPPAVFNLMVTEHGLPTGAGWNVTVGAGGVNAAGTATNLSLGGLNGTYTLTIPAVYLSTGVRYVANGSNPVPVKVTANGSTSVTFTEQFALTVASSSGGSVSGAPSGVNWEASGSAVTLTATPATGYQFAGWVGTGTGSAVPVSQASASAAVTVSGPTNETASFVPVVQQTSTGSSNAGQVPALGILAVLLVVGLVVGLILGRRRGGRPSDGTEETSPTEGGEAMDAEPAPDGDVYGSAPMAPPPGASGSPAEYDEGSG